MTLDSVALASVGGLSNPSKMPSLGYSTSASGCATGSKLAPIEGTVCHSCYALKGRYVMPNVKAATDRRLAIVREAVADHSAGERWVASMAQLLGELHAATLKRLAKGLQPAKGRDGRVFRWHDAGDLQGVAHLRLICRVAELTPSVTHWLPTREAGTVRSYLESGGSIPVNLTVRLSVPRVNGVVPPVYLKLRAMSAQIAFSQVHDAALPDGAQSCVAYQQGGECSDCRACWSADIASVSYPIH
jgi:hypothetical protein